MKKVNDFWYVDGVGEYIPNHNTKDYPFYATFYLGDKLLVVSERGKILDDHAVIKFNCDSLDSALKIIDSIESVKTV